VSNPSSGEREHERYHSYHDQDRDQKIHNREYAAVAGSIRTGAQGGESLAE